MTTVFLDKDGTLVEDVPYNVDPERIALVADAPSAIARLAAAECDIVIVTNQSGVARGLFEERALDGVRAHLEALVAAHGASLKGFYYCPHHPDGAVREFARGCECRKPADGLLRQAASDLGIELRDCWLVGDILDDIEAGNRAGCRTILVDGGHETEWRMSELRRPSFVVGTLDEAARVIVEAREAVNEGVAEEVG